MAGEAAKTLRHYGHLLIPLFDGEGLDIGAGDTPVLPDVDVFDLEQGDANEIGRHVQRTYDWVFSSHCLEHMRDPVAALREWFDLVRPGGRLIVIVPDEDLYEQGFQAGELNVDHRSTFTISKGRSWSARSVNVLDLVATLEAGVLELVQLQDDNLDRSLLTHGRPPLARLRRALTMPARIALRLRGAPLQSRVRLARWGGDVIDQTLLPDDRLAQIFFVIRKHADR